MLCDVCLVQPCICIGLDERSAYDIAAVDANLNPRENVEQPGQAVEL